MARKLPVCMEVEEFTNLIKHTKQKHHKIAFLLGFGSGLRISEVLNLTRHEVDMKDRKILVKQGKGSKDRVVPLPKGFKEEFLKSLPLKEIVNVRALQTGFKRACSRAGILEKKPTMHFHSLRHGFATHLISQGMPIHHVRTLMGHTNISTTNIYLIANPKDALKSYEELF